jgi:G3E family GTPase
MPKKISNREKVKRKRIPVTVLSGFLGAGKTTILNKLLSESNGKRITVIVNDMSEINIDAKLLKRTEEKMIELSNGCICCTLREDLLQQLVELGQSDNQCDYIVVESTGIAEPLHIAETFAYAGGIGNKDAPTSKDALGPVELDTMVTVVDMQTFFYHFDSKDKMYNLKSDANAGMSEVCPGTEERTLSHLLVDQVQFADVIVLNKCDLVSEGEVRDVMGVIADLNPFAKVVTSTFGAELPFASLLNTRLFSFSRAEQNAQWFAEDWESGAHTPETEEYGISSRTFRENSRPFHPDRLNQFYRRRTFGSAEAIRATAVGKSRLLRSKGFLWLASRHHAFTMLHHTGGSLEVKEGGKWWAEVDPSDWPPGEEFEKEVGRLVRGPQALPFGDRGHTLVLIGQHMSESAWEDCLQEVRTCLLTDAEMQLGPDGWKAQFGDPFCEVAAGEVAAEACAADHMHSDECGKRHERTAAAAGSKKRRVQREEEAEPDVSGRGQQVEEPLSRGASVRKLRRRG